jgi:hypothetical protein
MGPQPDLVRKTDSEASRGILELSAAPEDKHFGLLIFYTLLQEPAGTFVVW